MRKTMISVAAGKILPAKTIRFFHEKIQLFERKSTHSLRSTCHSTCPLSQRILLSKRQSRLYESFEFVASVVVMVVVTIAVIVIVLVVMVLLSHVLTKSRTVPHAIW